jgi:hypothetical protein
MNVLLQQIVDIEIRLIAPDLEWRSFSKLLVVLDLLCLIIKIFLLFIFQWLFNIFQSVDFLVHLDCLFSKLFLLFSG